MLRIALFAFVALVASAVVAKSADRAIIVQGVEKKFDNVGKRVALIVGNSTYQFADPLHNPVNDANEVARVLRQRGFELAGGGPQLDLDRNALARVVQLFGQAAEGAEVAFIYYSGHGAQVGGTNYLIPVDAQLTREADVDFQMLSADLVMNQLGASGASLKFLILDACRNNPFIDRGFKTVSRGLAVMRAPEGTLIGYSTQPGDVAADGAPGGNSPYTGALVSLIAQPGLDLFELFNQVGLDVMTRTNREQQPWLAASPIGGKFYFTPPGDNLVFASADLSTATPIITPVVLEQRPEEQMVSSGSSLPFIQEAYNLLSKRDYAVAHKVLSDAKAIDPYSAIPYSFDGFTYLMQAKELSEKAAKNGYRKGDVDAAQEVYTLAFQQFDQAIENDELYQPARRHRGNAIVSVNTLRVRAGRNPYDQLDRAVADLEVARDLDPTSQTAAASLGIAYALRGNYDLALQSFDDATELNPKYATPYKGRCAVFTELGETKRALSEANTAAKLASSLRRKTCLEGVDSLRE